MKSTPIFNRLLTFCFLGFLFETNYLNFYYVISSFTSVILIFIYNSLQWIAHLSRRVIYTLSKECSWTHVTRCFGKELRSLVPGGRQPPTKKQKKSPTLSPECLRKKREI